MDAVVGTIFSVAIGGPTTTVTEWIEIRHQWKIERRRTYLQDLVGVQRQVTRADVTTICI